jgi:hypothetical protein
MPLDTELATFSKMKADLLRDHAGKFALIKGDQLIGSFDTAENAFSAGVERFGREPFLVRKVTEQEEVYRNQAFALGLMNARI